MNAWESNEQPCTARTNSLWPHRYQQDAKVSADASITPGHHTCGATESGHADYTLERIRDAEWYEARYSKAVQINAAAPCMARGEDALLAEAHAEALRIDAQRAERTDQRVVEDEA